MRRPRELHYGWALVVALGLTETVSYGILSYAFPVFLEPMGRELGWSRTAMTGAFSLAALVAGVAAVPVGRLLDRHGARGVMTGGSVLATALLLAWAGVDRLWLFYLIWLGLGLASAAVLYEPAFAVVADWFDRRRGYALTVLTFMAGFASIIFVPLATWLVAELGWRTALVWLAGLLGALTVLPHAVLLRRRRERGRPARGRLRRGIPAREAVRSRSFRRLTLTFALGYLVLTGVSVHFIPLLLERGYDAAYAGAALGAVGVMALPGRLVLTPLGSHWPRTAVTAAIFGLQALGLAALLATPAGWGVWAFVVLFGAGFGAVTPARAALVAEFYGPAQYGRISGAMALFLAVARAAGPVGLSVLYVAVGGYDGVLWALVAVCLGAGVVMMGLGADQGALEPGLEVDQVSNSTYRPLRHAHGPARHAEPSARHHFASGRANRRANVEYGTRSR